MQTDRINCDLVELKFSPSPDAGIMEFSGYGAVFGNLDATGDVIEPGAFSKFIEEIHSGKQNWPAMLSQHGGWGATSQDRTPVGAWSELSEDKFGLKLHGKLADTPRGSEIYNLMKMTPRPAISGLSIGYIAREFKKREKPDEPKRLLKRIDVVEISPVTFPANNLARIQSVKSFENFSEKEFEIFLREAGLSKKEAQCVIAKGFRQLLMEREAEDNEQNELANLVRLNSKLIRGY